jgi:hypothetical protein
MTPQEIRTIQKNAKALQGIRSPAANEYHKYLGPITVEEFEERVAIKTICGRIPEPTALQQAYIEITDYYINKDSLFK